MNTLCHSLPACLFLAVGLACAQDAPVPENLSLAEAKRIALAGNPGVKALLARVQAAEAVVGQARSALAPQVNATAGASWLHDVSMPNGGGDDVPYYQLGVSAQWLLFDGFATQFRVEAAKAGTEANLATWQDGQRLLARGVAVSFLNCLLATEAGRVSERDAQFNNELLAEARKRLEAGNGPRVDVLNFSVRVRTAQNNLLGTRREVRAARQTLAALLGLAGGDLPATTVLTAPDLPSATLPDADAALQEALSLRPDLLRYQHAIAQLEAGIAATRADYQPRLAAQAAYSLDRIDNPRFHNDRDANSSIGLALTWNLFDGRLKHYSIAENQALLLATSESRNQLRVEIAAEVRRALDSAATAAEQYANQAEITDMSREIRDIVRKEYVSGLSPLTRLNEAQTDLVRAESNLAQSGIRHRQALEDLAAAIGSNLPQP